MKSHFHYLPYLLLIILMTGLKQSSAQQSQDIIRPILVNKDALSGIGLQKIELEDEPEKDFHQRRIYWGDDIGVFVVSTESWVNRMDNFPFDEYIFMYNGEVEVRPDEGSVQQFYTGDHFWAPKGYTGEWEIKAGDYLHYELSVIATQRADSTAISKYSEHIPISKSDISGSHIILDEEGNYSKMLIDGAELSIFLKAELPREKSSFINNKEQLIHLISGQILITDSGGEEHIYTAGDFFILRDDLSGMRESKGHGLVKYLSVQGVAY